MPGRARSCSGVALLRSTELLVLRASSTPFTTAFASLLASVVALAVSCRIASGSRWAGVQPTDASRTKVMVQNNARCMTTSMQSCRPEGVSKIRNLPEPLAEETPPALSSRKGSFCSRRLRIGIGCGQVTILTTTMNPTIRAPRGSQLRCKGWQQEAALRCLMNNLDPEVAERPADLVVYGGIGKAARNWECFHAIVRELEQLGDEDTLLVQSGKPVAVFPTHEMAPRVIIANSNLVGKWANWEHFHELDRKGLMMYGQMTAGSWIYIGTQGILQGTFQTFAAIADQRFGGSLEGRLVLTGGLGGMGGAQPLAITMNGGVALCVEVDPERAQRRKRQGWVDEMTDSLDEAVAIVTAAVR